MNLYGSEELRCGNFKLYGVVGEMRRSGASHDRSANSNINSLTSFRPIGIERQS
jgi:hypothetical protein